MRQGAFSFDLTDKLKLASTSIDESLLRKMAKPNQPISVRKSVATNPICPLDLLIELANTEGSKDSSWSDIRRATIHNPNATLEIHLIAFSYKRGYLHEELYKAKVLEQTFRAYAAHLGVEESDSLPLDWLAMLVDDKPLGGNSWKKWLNVLAKEAPAPKITKPDKVPV